MKRLLGLSAMVLLLVVVAMSHRAMAISPPTVTLCHLVTSKTLPNGNTQVVGHIIQVPVTAVPAHLAHGDQLAPTARRGACCAFCIKQNGTRC